jgi:hypothetical protein
LIDFDFKLGNITTLSADRLRVFDLNSKQVKAKFSIQGDNKPLFVTAHPKLPHGICVFDSGRLLAFDFLSGT